MTHISPIIGIPTWNRSGRSESKDLMSCGVTNSYLLAISKAGGIPLLIPSFEDTAIASQLFPLIDGLLLTGGEDINPRRYAREPHPKLGAVSDIRDEIELFLIEQAWAEKLPIFAICRGAQMLNVARGGTLLQDIPSEAPEAHAHRVHPDDAEWSDLSNICKLSPESCLAHIFGSQSFSVNSLHHQAIGEVGKDLVVTARSHDGIIEIIEGLAGFFCVGVQSHPEMMSEDRLWKESFQFFIKESEAWKRSRGGRANL